MSEPKPANYEEYLYKDLHEMKFFIRECGKMLLSMGKRNIKTELDDRGGATWSNKIVTSADVQSDLFLETNFHKLGYSYFSEKKGVKNRDLALNQIKANKEGYENRVIADPLDGTGDHYNDWGPYCISIAVQRRSFYSDEEFKTVMGILYIPPTNEMYWAIGDERTRMNEIKIGLSTTSSLSDAKIAHEDFFHGKDGKKELRPLTKLIQECQQCYSHHATAPHIGAIMKGSLDAITLGTVELHDILAGAFCLKNLGGNFYGWHNYDSPANAKELHTHKYDILGTNGNIELESKLINIIGKKDTKPNFIMVGAQNGGFYNVKN